MLPPQTVWILTRFGLKTGIDFAHFGLESGSRDLRWCMNIFVNWFKLNKK